MPSYGKIKVLEITIEDLTNRISVLEKLNDEMVEEIDRLEYVNEKLEAEKEDLKRQVNSLSIQIADSRMERVIR